MAVDSIIEGIRANIFYNYNQKDIVTKRMGNTVQQKPSLLVKNWVKVDNHTYRNSITEELIDEHLLQYSCEEAMQSSHAQLVRRANINHPNIIKLIYFCTDSQNNCCTDKTFRHRVFIQHPNQQLFHYINANRIAPKDTHSKNDCFCCPIANAFAYLAERYGYFHVNDSMIFLLSQIKWHKSCDKKTVKVWINSQLQDNRPELACKQDEMVRNLKDIYDRMANAGLCFRLDSLQVTPNMKLVQFLQEIYRAHNNVFQRVQQRKRVLSTYTSSNHNILNTNPSLQSVKLMKTNIISSKYLEPNYTSKNLNTTIEVDRKIDETETIKKTAPSSAARKIITIDSGVKQLVSPFYRPKQTSKINFAYNDNFSTPKQTKAVQSLNSSSPCIIINHQQSANKHIPINQPNQLVIFVEQSQNSNKKENSKAPRLQRMTVNVMVKCQSPIKESNELSSRLSEQRLTNKLAQILESQQHIVSSPNIAGIDIPQAFPVEQRCAQSMNQSEYERQREKNNESQSAQQQQILHYEYQNQAPQINIETSTPINEPYFFQEPHIPLSQSIRESEKSHQERMKDFKQPGPSQYFTSFEMQTANDINDESNNQQIPNFGSISGPPLLMHTSKQVKSLKSKKSLQQSQPYQSFPSASHSQSEYSRLDTNYNKYLKKFNQAMNPISPRSKFSGKQQPFESMPIHSVTSNKIPEPFKPKTYSKYNSLNLEQGISRRKSKYKGNQMEMSDGRHNAIQSGQLQSLYNESISSEQEKKARIIEKIQNTEKIIRENRKKLQKIELEKDLQREKQIIKKEMQSLLKNNLMSDESNRIKEKVKYKRATFAELKAQASKILEDLNF